MSPDCSLKADVQWEMSDVHGNGYLRADRQTHLYIMSGEGNVGDVFISVGRHTHVIRYCKMRIKIFSLLI